MHIARLWLKSLYPSLKAAIEAKKKPRGCQLALQSQQKQNLGLEHQVLSMHNDLVQQSCVLMGIYWYRQTQYPSLFLVAISRGRHFLSK